MTASCPHAACTSSSRAQSVVPMNPMVDGWRGDDWFHNGAFRQQNLPYIYEQTGNPRQQRALALQQLRRLRHVHERRLRRRTRPSNATWTRSASGKRSPTTPPTTASGATRPSTASSPPSRFTVPTMLVPASGIRKTSMAHLAVYKASSPKTRTTTNSSSCFGPWHHGQEIDGRRLPRGDQVPQRHRPLFPRADSRTIPRALSKDDAPPMTSLPSSRLRPAQIAGKT